MSNSTNSVKMNNGDCQSDEDIKCMIEQVNALLGGGVVDIEIPDKTWCLLLSMAIDDYVSSMQQWLIRNQWGVLANKGLNVTDICYALTTRNLDFAKEFSNAYSAQVGLQAGGNGSYPLKKDFITLKSCQQVYEIPKGREINEVLWTDSTTLPFAMSNSNNNDYSLGLNGNSVASTSNNLSRQGTQPYYIVPAYDTVLRASDYRLKQKFLGYEAFHRVTEGEDGKKYLHLYNGSDGTPLAWSNCRGCGSCSTCKSISQCKVYYHYYDMNQMTEEERAKCVNECKNIIKYPHQVPLEETNFCDLNGQSRTWVRKYLTALAKETLGNIRGKFGGAIPMPDSELTMDYSHFFSEAQTEKEALMTQLSDLLEQLTNNSILEKQAQESEFVSQILQNIPTGIWVK